MSEASAREVVTTFRSVFPHVVAFNDRDLILLGSDRPIRFSLERMIRRFADPAVRASLAEAYVRYPADLLVKLRLDERGVAQFGTGAALNTDDNMRLELAAPRTLYQDRLAAILAELDPVPAGAARSADRLRVTGRGGGRAGRLLLHRRALRRGPASLRTGAGARTVVRGVEVAGTDSRAPGRPAPRASRLAARPGRRRRPRSAGAGAGAASQHRSRLNPGPTRRPAGSCGAPAG